jgi:hypothetical protein
VTPLRACGDILLTRIYPHTQPSVSPIRVCASLPWPRTTSPRGAQSLAGGVRELDTVLIVGSDRAGHLMHWTRRAGGSEQEGLW